MLKALFDVGMERERQINVEGYDEKHDDIINDDCELAFAAAAYCIIDYQPKNAERLWPEGWSDIKPKDHRSNMVRAAALLIAEIERIDRDR